MFMKKLLFLIFGLFLLTGCPGPGGIGDEDWGTDWGSGAALSPTDITDTAQPSSTYGTPPADNEIKTVSVLLPLSGPGGGLGAGIQRSIEMAFFQKQPQNILVSFHDISGRTEDKRRIIESVISSKPDMIIGPLFADDVEILKNIKPHDIPAITFTSARHMLGNGIFTMALLPNQAVEAIVKHIKAEEKERLLILVPNTSAGFMLANTAIETAEIYGQEIAGLYFYEEHNTDDMNEMASKVALFESRVENLAHAKEILSDVLMQHKLPPTERDSTRRQLEDLNKRDSLGEVPYDSVLFLGNAADSKTLSAYLRYYDVPASKVPFYGSALWDTDTVFRDSSLAGGEYASLVRIPENFAKNFSDIEGVKPNRFNTVGFDAAMLSIKALTNDGPAGAVLLNPSGHRGLDGLVRLRPNGENERALQIMQLNGVRLPAIKTRPARDFTKPIYKATKYDLDKPSRQQLLSAGYNPLEYITLPKSLRGSYDAKTIGEIRDESIEHMIDEEVKTIEEDTEVVKDNDFKPTAPKPVDKKLIDEVKMLQQ